MTVAEALRRLSAAVAPTGKGGLPALDSVGVTRILDGDSDASLDDPDDRDDAIYADDDDIEGAW
jgi:hypothetical protein